LDSIAWVMTRCAAHSKRAAVRQVTNATKRFAAAARQGEPYRRPFGTAATGTAPARGG
jgi:hypothetical protein